MKWKYASIVCLFALASNSHATPISIDYDISDTPLTLAADGNAELTVKWRLISYDLAGKRTYGEMNTVGRTGIVYGATTWDFSGGMTATIADDGLITTSYSDDFITRGGNGAITFRVDNFDIGGFGLFDYRSEISSANNDKPIVTKSTIEKFNNNEGEWGLLADVNNKNGKKTTSGFVVKHNVDRAEPKWSDIDMKLGLGLANISPGSNEKKSLASLTFGEETSLEIDEVTGETQCLKYTPIGRCRLQVYSSRVNFTQETFFVLPSAPDNPDGTGFSPTAIPIRAANVPEPMPLSLLGAGLAVLGLRRKFFAKVA